MGKGKIVIVGGGLAGLMATIKAESWDNRLIYFLLVLLNALTQFVPKRGINGAVNTKGEGILHISTSTIQFMAEIS